jgi:hypothetical protein
MREDHRARPQVGPALLWDVRGAVRGEHGQQLAQEAGQQGGDADERGLVEDRVERGLERQQAADLEVGEPGDRQLHQPLAGAVEQDRGVRRGGLGG